MPTARPFARNTGAPIAGTEQVGNLAVGIPTAGFAATGLPWWNGPDEDLGYVIATQVAANNQPTPVPENIVTSGLVLYLDAGNGFSYPGSGTTWTDLSGNNNNGTLTNGPTYNSANGGAIVFDGTNDYVDVLNNSSTLFDNNQSHSFSLWLRKDGSNSGTFAYIYDRYGTYRIPGLLFNFNTNTLAVEWRSSTNSTWAFNLTGLSVDSGIWNFVTVTINAPGAGQTKTINVYLYKSTGLSTVTLFNSIDWNASTSGPFYIGQSISNTTFFNGRVSQVMTYNKELSASEVTQNYNALKGRFGL